MRCVEPAGQGSKQHTDLPHPATPEWHFGALLRETEIGFVGGGTLFDFSSPG